MSIQTQQPNRPPGNERFLANPIRVSSVNRDAFQRALTRGQERRLEIDSCGVRGYGVDGMTHRYGVQAWSQPGLTHNVMIYRSTGGAVEAACDCHAAFAGRPCQHSALAIQAADWWPWPIASQLDALDQLTRTEPTNALEPLLNCIAIQAGRFVYVRCPHCGSDHEHGLITYSREADHTHDWFTRCVTCNASPGWAKDVHAAIAKQIAEVIKQCETVQGLVGA